MEKTAMEINQNIMDLIVRFCEIYEIPPNTVIIDLAQSKKLFEDAIQGRPNIATPEEADKFVLGQKEYGSELKIFTVKGKNILKVGLVGDNDFFDEIEKKMEASKE
jgi:hypothetical protein